MKILCLMLSMLICNYAVAEYIKFELDNKIYEGNVSAEQYAKIQQCQKNIAWAKDYDNYLEIPRKNLEVFGVGVLLLAFFFNIKPEIVLPIAALPVGVGLTGIGLTLYEKQVRNALQKSMEDIK